MKTVQYSVGDPWTGEVQCPSCGVTTHSWQSSGMSDICPHFYCDVCSNVLHRAQDYERVYVSGASHEVLAAIAGTLPGCPCGGHFKVDTSPKCPACRFVFAHQDSPLKRLSNPYMLVLDGACVCGSGEPIAVVQYRVEFTKATATLRTARKR